MWVRTRRGWHCHCCHWDGGDGRREGDGKGTLLLLCRHGALPHCCCKVGEDEEEGEGASSVAVIIRTRGWVVRVRVRGHACCRCHWDEGEVWVGENDAWARCWWETSSWAQKDHTSHCHIALLRNLQTCHVCCAYKTHQGPRGRQETPHHYSVVLGERESKNKKEQGRLSMVDVGE